MIQLKPGLRPSSLAQLAGGYLGTQESATPFQAGETPIEHLKLPAGITRAERDRQIDTLAKLNSEFHERYAFDQEVSARTRSYELAGSLQMVAPELVDGRPMFTKVGRFRLAVPNA